MSKLDLIIKALQVSYAHVPGDIADRHHEALVAARELMDQSAEPEQEPCGWQFFQDGEWHNGSLLNNHRKNTEDGGWPVRDIYPSPPRNVRGLADEG
jgi:hypothetical protein